MRRKVEICAELNSNHMMQPFHRSPGLCLASALYKKSTFAKHNVNTLRSHSCSTNTPCIQGGHSIQLPQTTVLVPRITPPAAQPPSPVRPQRHKRTAPNLHVAQNAPLHSAQFHKTGKDNTSLTPRSAPHGRIAVCRRGSPAAIHARDSCWRGVIGRWGASRVGE